MTKKMLLAACAALSCANAGASGDIAYDRFVNRGAPDVALARYQAGELGVVLPSYQRAYLYAAWRAIALGAQELKAAPNPAGGLARAIGNQQGGWLDAGNGTTMYAAWQNAINSTLKQASTPKKDGDMDASGYLNCPLNAYTLATANLLELGKRDDATPERLRAWIAAQRQVFKFCGDDPGAPQRGYGAPKPHIEPPAELAAGAPLHWRQMQQYQRASAAFYDGDYAASAPLFAQIGATAQHPMRQWGDYLSLRSLARAASQAAAKEDAARAPAALAARQERLTALNALADRILRDPTLANLHEATRAVLRAVQARVTPEARFAELSKLLDEPHANPYLDDHLGDWRVLANNLLESGNTEQSDAAQKNRATAGFFDWIQTMNGCADVKDARRKPADTACAGEAAHALAQWRRAGANQAQARVWLVAAALKAGALPPEVEQAALKVAAGAPEYATLRYALARHYRLKRQADKARAIDDAMLAASATTSIGARNLFLQERFAMATSPADAGNYLLRAVDRDADADTGETAPATGKEIPAADGLRWLNGKLANADLMALASNPAFDPALRARIAVAAWMRADLLGQADSARQAAQQVAQLMPSLAPAMAQYQAVTGAPGRRHAMLLNALKFGLSPVIGDNYPEPNAKLRDKDETLADMWCKIPSGAANYAEPDTETELSPPAPETGNDAIRNQEMAALADVKTATDFVGNYVLKRAADTPNDPDLPWLLHVVVQSTRGGCIAGDAKAMSKRAFTLLHQRYKDNEWASKTPYFY
ncbi:hypothetical protein AAKU55_004815 [Oxalobacteraceae bacterium GrIS 1.11]